MAIASASPPKMPIMMDVETTEASPVERYCDHGHNAPASKTTSIRKDLLIVPRNVMPASPTSGRGRLLKVLSFNPGLPVRRRGAGVGIGFSLQDRRVLNGRAPSIVIDCALGNRLRSCTAGSIRAHHSL